MTNDTDNANTSKAMELERRLAAMEAALQQSNTALDAERTAREEQERMMKYQRESQIRQEEEQRHTGRFDSKFSHIFKSNTKFEPLYKRRSKVNIHVKYLAKWRRTMDQCQSLQPCPHFMIILSFMVNLRSKIYFL